MRSAWAITLAVVTPTRRPVNSPGPMPDRDRGEVVERDAGLVAEVLDRGRELLGVTAPVPSLTSADHRARRRRSRR